MMDHGGGDTAAGGGSSGGGSSGGDGGGVRDFGVPPPFLTRIFSMVNDPNTNSFISWSPSGTSFIVWDHIQFSAKLLPQYFKHSNFSSFIYQLNNYGFRKIGVEHQWEYENQYFQAGKEHFLQKIRRRSQRQETSKKQKRTRKPFLALNKYEMELVLNNLRNSTSELKLEIQKQKQKRQHMEIQIIAFKEQHANSLNKSKNLLILLAKALDEISVQPVRKERDHGDDNGSRKKPRMENTATTNEALDAFNEEIGTPIEEHNKVDLISEESGKDSSDYNFWKKLLEEDDTDENGAKEMVNIKQQAKIELELENLI